MSCAHAVLHQSSQHLERIDNLNDLPFPHQCLTSTQSKKIKSLSPSPPTPATESQRYCEETINI